MRIGSGFMVQNYGDWDRYEAEERGEDVPSAPEISDQSIFLEEVELAQMADGLGFDSLWTVEHHFTPYTMVTNPIQMLTYLAGTTQQADLGTMVVVTPWHNPVRVAEDIVMLDSLLGPDRSVMCGVGRGLGRREYAGLNVDQNEARGRFDEAIEILKQLLSTGTATFDGEFYQLDSVRLRPQPHRDLSEVLFGAGGTAESVQIIAANGMNPLTIPTVSLEVALQNARTFADIRQKAGHGPTGTKLALWTYCAETHEEAQQGAEKYLANYADSALRHYELTGKHFGELKGYESYSKLSDLFRQESNPFAQGFVREHPWGTPDEVTAKIKRIAEDFGATEIMLLCKFGGMTMAEAVKNMNLVANEVMPGLKEFNPEPIMV